MMRAKEKIERLRAEIEKQLLAYLGNEPQAVSPALVMGFTLSY